jgi:hypothetical protein
MFTSFTWADFLIAASLCMAAYYGFLAPLLFRKEILYRLQSYRRNVKQSGSAGSNEAASKVHSVMGNIHEDTSWNKLYSDAIAAAEITVESLSPEPETIQTPTVIPNDALLIGSVADLLQDIKTLLHQMAGLSTERTEVQSLLQALLQRYPYLLGTSFQYAVTVYICEEVRNHLHLQLTTTEILSWWS